VPEPASAETLTQSQPLPFVGFARPQGTIIPDEILDGMGSRPYPETMVLLYIARRTFGFRKDSDAISYNQFIDGIKKRDGTVLDTGCGIRSRKTLSATIKALEERGMIVAERLQQGGRSQVTVYRLRLRDEEPTVHGSPGLLRLVPRGNRQGSPGEPTTNSLPTDSQQSEIAPPILEGGESDTSEPTASEVAAPPAPPGARSS
jgi:hypothetical protein